MTRAGQLRRGVWTLVALVPVVELLGSASVEREGDLRLLGVILMVGATLVGALNLHLSLSGWLYSRKLGSLDGYRHVSGFPFIGTILVVLGGALTFGLLPCALHVPWAGRGRARNARRRSPRVAQAPRRGSWDRR